MKKLIVLFLLLSATSFPETKVLKYSFDIDDKDIQKIEKTYGTYGWEIQRVDSQRIVILKRETVIFDSVTVQKFKDIPQKIKDMSKLGYQYVDKISSENYLETILIFKKVK